MVLHGDHGCRSNGTRAASSYGLIYGLTALLGTGLFVIFAFQVFRRREMDPSRMGPERRLFKYSILYLFLLFGAVVIDRWLLA